MLLPVSRVVSDQQNQTGPEPDRISDHDPEFRTGPDRIYLNPVRFPDQNRIQIIIYLYLPIKNFLKIKSYF